jgi:DNA-binding transcriptional LysR family regulator
MDDIEIRLFRYFVALCEEKHFGRAAERLNKSQPTLSNQLQKLEKRLGTQLVKRKGKSAVEITKTGMRFLESARNVLHQVSEAELSALQAARGEIGRIEVGYMLSTAYCGLLQRFIGGFQKANPGIEITLHHRSTVGVIASVASNEMDAGFARHPKQYPMGVAGFSIYRHPLMLAVPGDHPLAKRTGPIDPKTISNELFVTTQVTFDMAFTRHVEVVSRIGGFTPRLAKRAEDLTSVLIYVSCGYGIAVVSEEMSNFRIPNVVYKRIAAASQPEIIIDFMYREKETAPACKALIEAMRPHALENNVPRPKLLRPIAS